MCTWMHLDNQSLVFGQGKVMLKSCANGKHYKMYNVYDYANLKETSHARVHM